MDDLTAARIEYERQIRKATRETVATAWEAIDRHRASTAEAEGLIAEGFLDDYHRQALADLGSVKEVATTAKKALVVAAVRGGMMSAREVARVAGVTHNTVLKWVSEVETSESVEGER